ncbi:hypothetical protein GQ44DRAFT_624959 [Phaeosphaeriaceae sp. PMI808]|nr:hypothetical protein GQ44DRAFT_624959 [Phaeosphaeriaceae sp. PMI808]
MPLDSHITHVSALQPHREEKSTKSAQGTCDSSANTHFPLRTWWKEWALVVLSLGFLIAIIVIFRIYNGRTQPNWRLGLNLNTVIALLATLLRSSLVTSTVIGQAKWCWQHRRRPVQHLAYFDEASRGPLGALLLCFKIPALVTQRLLFSR